jgi:hypothetical protein
MSRRGKKRTEYRIEARLFVRAVSEKEAQKFSAQFQDLLTSLAREDFKWGMAYTGSHVKIEPLD